MRRRVGGTQPSTIFSPLRVALWPGRSTTRARGLNRSTLSLFTTSTPSSGSPFHFGAAATPTQASQPLTVAGASGAPAAGAQRNNADSRIPIVYGGPSFMPSRPELCPPGICAQLSAWCTGASVSSHKLHPLACSFMWPSRRDDHLLCPSVAPLFSLTFNRCQVRRRRPARPSHRSSTA